MATKAVLLGAAALLVSLIPTYPGQSLAPDQGWAGRIPAYYDGRMLTVDLHDVPPGIRPVSLGRGRPVHHIYLCGACEGFAAVLDTVRSADQDGSPLLWREMQLIFNAGHAQRQLISDQDVYRAAADGEITLFPTGAAYRCTVVDPGR